MADKQLSTPTKPAGQRVFDFDISAVLIAERVVGEIFGWDLVDWSAVEPHKGRKFFFGRQWQADASIHDRLKPFFDRCDPTRNEFSALRPSPVVNANLSKLVGHLCRHVGRHAMLADETEAPALQRTEKQDRLHLAATRHLLGRIDTEPSLGERAVRLKRIATAAESELEKHFADLINDRLERGFLQGGDLDPLKFRGLRDQAKGRLEETDALNERELAGLSKPDLALDDEALIRIEMAKILLGRFPYVRNYELMLHAELAMLQRPLTPRFSRERMLWQKKGDVDAALIERLDRALADVASHAGPTWLSRGWLSSQATPSSKDQRRTIAICGSGPLPMTALFLHLFTGAAIVLIDDDQAAAERSKRLIANLERLGILEPRALTVHQENAGQVNFRSTGKLPRRAGGSVVACDAVMIASLVDTETKEMIAAQFASDPMAPPLLIMRSATGLSARLAYDPVPTETFSCGQLAYCGETLPSTQVATHLNRTEAIRRGVACVTSADALAIAHPDVVNTTEVYCRISADREPFDLDFHACETIEDWIRRLEKVGIELGPADAPS